MDYEKQSCEPVSSEFYIDGVVSITCILTDTVIAWGPFLEGRVGV